MRRARLRPRKADPARFAPHEEREAARILSRLVRELHVLKEEGGTVKLEADLPEELFDRLSLWGSACEDLEDDGTHEPV